MIKKEEKKTEHTRMYAQLCSSVNAIFTSVVVYSRTSTNQKITFKHCGRYLLHKIESDRLRGEYIISRLLDQLAVYKDRNNDK